MNRLLNGLKGGLLVLVLSVSLSGCFYGGGQYYRYGYAPARPNYSYSYRRPNYNYNRSYNYNRNYGYNRNHSYSHGGYNNYSHDSRNRNYIRGGNHRR